MNQSGVGSASDGDAVCTGVTEDLAAGDISTNIDGVSSFTTSKGRSGGIT